LGADIREAKVYPIHSKSGSEIRRCMEQSEAEFKSRVGIPSTVNILAEFKSPFPSQSDKATNDYLNLYPLVPQFCYVSNAARFSGNPWNLGAFLKGMLAAGSGSEVELKETWKWLFEKISVNEEDDVWTRVIGGKIYPFSNGGLFDWSYRDIDTSDLRPFLGGAGLLLHKLSPAVDFVKNLRKIGELKSKLTRRQWISILESYIRISMIGYVTWVIDMNINLLNLLWDDGAIPGSGDNFAKSLADRKSWMMLDSPSELYFKDACGRYAHARLLVNLVAHMLFEKGVALPDTWNDIDKLRNWIISAKLAMDDEFRKQATLKMLEIERKAPGLRHSKRGFTKNMLEFMRHCIGQKTTADFAERTFDQGYWSCKVGAYRNSPWIFKLGPVAVLALASVSMQGEKGTASDVEKTLRSLGFMANADKLLQGSLGKSLHDLGLTSDSPDGERGVIINNPFK
jgi:hypothetical protein